MTMLNLLLIIMLDSQAPHQSNFDEVLPYLLILLSMVLSFYFLMVRPEKRRYAEVQRLAKKLNIGEQVVTFGGIKGEICEIKEDWLVLKLDEKGSTMEVMTDYISPDLSKPFLSVTEEKYPGLRP